MAKKYLKFIAKSSYRKQLEQFLEDLVNNNLAGYDIKKLIGYDNLYRARIGEVRCIFNNNNGIYSIIDINYRRQIYNSL